MTDNKLDAFVEQARSKGLHNQEIKDLLNDVGWDKETIAKAVYGDWIKVPKPEHPATALNSMSASAASSEPISVVQNLSTRGFEYSIMFVSLLVSAFSLGLILHQFVNGVFTEPITTEYAYSGSEGGEYAFPATLLLVTLPIFVYMFLRLKRAELDDPALRKDPSRKRMSHFTQFLAFAFGVGYIVYFLYTLLSGSTDSNGAGSVAESFFHMLITLGIAGTIFGYFWNDEHRAAQ
jgi:hypothetical protein